MNQQPVDRTKFSNPLVTASGDKRAWVTLNNLKTLWFNTGTRCNLSCTNCYIESSPTNDELSYIDRGDLVPYLDEIIDQKLATQEIGFTGGEPFLNPQIIDLLQVCLDRGFKTIVLTNGYRIMNRHKKDILELSKQYGDQFLLRVSLDHYSSEVHDAERGEGTFAATLKSLKWLTDNSVNFAIAGRSLTDEELESCRQKYAQVFAHHQIAVDCDDLESLVLFAEMDDHRDVPEITTDCWRILNKKPDDVMCASSRMIVKRKDENTPKVLSCTLLAYDEQFEMGQTLEDSKKDVYLNHPFCSQFCVLGGSSCS